LRPFTNKATLT